MQPTGTCVVEKSTQRAMMVLDEDGYNNGNPDVSQCIRMN